MQLVTDNLFLDVVPRNWYSFWFTKSQFVVRRKTAELTSYSNTVQPLHIATSSNWNILLVALIQAALPSPGLVMVKLWQQCVCASTLCQHVNILSRWCENGVNIWSTLCQPSTLCQNCDWCLWSPKISDRNIRVRIVNMLFLVNIVIISNIDHLALLLSQFLIFSFPSK